MLGAGCGTQVSTSYTYDAGTNGIGRRTGMSSLSNNETVSSAWTYDARGRMVSEAKTISGQPYTYTTSWTYNYANLPISMTYPDGEIVNTAYDARKHLYSLSSLQGTYVQSTTYDSAGRLTGRVLGNNVITASLAYYNWPLTNGGRLSSANYSNGEGVLQTLAYTYDAVGNAKTISDSLTSELQSFNYDALDRLTSATVTNGPAPYSETYGYNAASGNLTTKGSLTLSYNDAAHTHAATSAGTNSYAYDQDGNMNTRTVAGQTFTLGYDAEGHLVTVTGPSLNASFVYDGDGARVKSTINNVTTTFVGNHYEVCGSTITKYYLAGSDRVAMRTNGTLNYLLSDHLGSTSITTDAAGTKIAELRYKAWGEVRYNSGSTPTKYTYTGQYDYTPSFGLQFFNARWYDNALGRFVQADTVVPDGPQGYDRYAYANNSPIVNSDPSGHCSVGGTGFWNSLSCAATAIANTVKYIAKNGVEISSKSFTIPIVIPGGYGLEEQIINHTVSFKEVRTLGKYGDDLIPVTAIIGWAATVAPEQIEDFQSGASLSEHMGDFLIDSGGFVASEIAGDVAGLLTGPLGPIALPISIGVDVGTGTLWEDWMNDDKRGDIIDWLQYNNPNPPTWPQYPSNLPTPAPIPTPTSPFPTGTQIPQ